MQTYHWEPQPKPLNGVHNHFTATTFGSHLSVRSQESVTSMLIRLQTRQPWNHVSLLGTAFPRL